jgi:hypothetical protein
LREEPAKRIVRKAPLIQERMEPQNVNDNEAAVLTGDANAMQLSSDAPRTQEGMEPQDFIDKDALTGDSNPMHLAKDEAMNSGPNILAFSSDVDMNHGAVGSQDNVLGFPFLPNSNPGPDSDGTNLPSNPFFSHGMQMDRASQDLFIV